jgi:membrane-associated phospholipid phosphatase
MIVLVVFVLDVRRRRQVPRLLACVLLPGLVNLLLKQTVARFRPTQFVQGQAISLPESAWDTFAGWTAALPPDGFEHAPNHVLQSFGSGHTAVAVGLAIGLTWMYPRGGWVFFLVAALAAAQRIDSGAHFVSDTLVAAAIACFAGALCLYPIPFGMLWNPVALGNGSTKSHSPDREGRGAMEINEEA